MPLIRIDAVAGRTPEERKAVLDATHRAVLSAFGMHERDRCQVYHEHAPGELILEDTGSASRGPRRRSSCKYDEPEAVRAEGSVLRELVAELERAGTPPTDVVVSVVSNTREDFSFGNGRVQYVTGEL